MTTSSEIELSDTVYTDSDNAKDDDGDAVPSPTPPQIAGESESREPPTASSDSGGRVLPPNVECGIYKAAASITVSIVDYCPRFCEMRLNAQVGVFAQRW